MSSRGFGIGGKSSNANNRFGSGGDGGSRSGTFGIGDGSGSKGFGVNREDTFGGSRGFGAMGDSGGRNFIVLLTNGFVLAHSQSFGGARGGSRGGCHSCGEMGHLARNCTRKTDSATGSFGRSDNESKGTGFGAFGQKSGATAMSQGPTIAVLDKKLPPSITSKMGLLSETSDVACICNRPKALVVCKQCGYEIEGRIQKVCDRHPNRQPLMDLRICPICRTNSLIEERVS